MGKSVGEKIAESRRAYGISQGKLAKLAGLSQAGISIIEGGKASPTEETLARIASALGMSVSTLLEDDKDKKEAGQMDSLMKEFREVLIQLSPEKRSHVLAMARFLAAEEASQKP